MNEQEKQDYLERYKVAKEKGVPFFPDILFKDAVAVLVIFLIVAALAYFIGAPLEARANPADTTYTPRPEWYFLFLFQLLKYFPGSLEFLGVVVLPTLAILGLFLLPFLDRNSKRHYSHRLLVIGFTSIVVVSILLLTFLAYREAPPPAQAQEGDQTAALYAKNCAPCHGSSIDVAPGIDLHNIIAQGKHEGMPPWSADLTTDQIDALAGFILSPVGSMLFTENCGACHEASELVAGSPIELKTALDQGPDYPAHEDANVPDWSKKLSPEELTKLLNFLVAPDGQRLFAINCAPCHGTSIAFSDDEDQLRSIIGQGGKHLDMPPWKEKLSSSELDTLANFVVNPSSTAGGAELFKTHCSTCHGERIPSAADVSQARQIIATGGSHETMPVWGNVLTAEQLTALTNYTLESAKGTPIEVGQDLFDQNCTSCHGALGEGGPNPTRPGDIIAPISTGEFLKTRDDFTLKAIISQGQPNFGMSPFGISNGGPLDDDQIDAIVAFMRSWEANPPVELPPEVASAQVPLNPVEVFDNICSQCHGQSGEGGIGPSFVDPKFQSSNTDQAIFDSIKLGHPATPMIGWSDVLSDEQIQELVGYIREFGQKQPEQPTEQSGQPPEPTQESTEQPTLPASKPTFVTDILPIFKSKCVMCHGSLGGWDGSSYEKVMTTGDHAPVVIPGDTDGSILAQKLLDTQTFGTVMPPGSKLPDDEIQVILDWIAAGAPEK